MEINQMSTNSNRGSEWKKWDLHIHSPLSHGTSNRYGKTSTKEFCDAIRRKGVAAIGLTNYFYITEEEYDSITKELNGEIYVIPNIEFRSPDKSKKGDYINYHVLFRPEIGIKEILKSLSKVTLHNRENKYCTPETIQELGFDAVTVDIKALLNQLNIDFKATDDFVVASPYTGSYGFKADEKPRNIELEIKYDKYTDIIFGGGQSEELVSYFLNERTFRGNSEIIKTKKPTVKCSDAHSLNEVCEKYTWIKAAVTFEGFKQIIFEPDQRVKINELEPDTKESQLVIKEAQFVDSSGRFSNEKIPFNKNLNVIIGGKSSGKSILLYNIAKTLLVNGSDDEVLKYKNPDTNRVQFKYEFPENFDFIVHLESGVSQSILRNEDEPSILTGIKYIPQNYLSELADRKYKQSNNLNKLIRELLFEDAFYKEEYRSFLDRLQANDNLREGIINSYFDCKKKIIELKSSLRELGNIDAITVNIGAYESEINELKSNLGLKEEDLKNYDILSTELQTIALEKAKIENDSRRILSFNNELNAFFQELNSKKNTFINSLENKAIKEHYIAKYAKVEEWLNDHADEVALFKIDENRNFIKDNIVKSNLENITKEIARIEELLKPFQNDVTIKTKIQNIEKKILDEQTKLQTIKQRNAEIKKAQTVLENEHKKLFDLYRSNYLEYENIISILAKRIKFLEDKSLIIEGKVKFNFKRFREKFLAMSNLTNKSFREFDILSDDIDVKMNIEINSFSSKLEKIFDLLVSGEYVLKKNIEVKEACKALLEDHFYDYNEVSSDNDTLYDMSTGKASFIILKLIIGLSISKSPILIDQPEDNLDNRSITKDLVAYLKEKKLDRQIILVTHNPNIVVNADAENVIVAHQKGQNEEDSSSLFQFEYLNGPLEFTQERNFTEKNILKSMGIREHVADIVEGGKEAFKSREIKYRF